MLYLNIETFISKLSFNGCVKKSVLTVNDYVKNCNLLVLKNC